MTTFVIVHGAADSGWSWHLVAQELQVRGHRVVTPDLPCEDDSAGFPDYATAVIAAVGNHRDLIIVGHSLGGYTATLVADRLPVQGLVLLSAMIPLPGEPASDWWANSGYKAFVAAGTEDGEGGPIPESDQFYNGVPSALVTQSEQHARGQSGTPMSAPWPLPQWPDLPTRFIVCTEDRFFPPAFMRQVVADRLPDVVPDVVPGGHMVMLSHPVELATLLDWYSREMSKTGRAGLPAPPDSCLEQDRERLPGFRLASHRRLMARPGPKGPDWRCPLTGTLNRSDSAIASPVCDLEEVTGRPGSDLAIDPSRTSALRSAQAICLSGARLVGRIASPPWAPAEPSPLRQVSTQVPRAGSGE